MKTYMLEYLCYNKAIQTYYKYHSKRIVAATRLEIDIVA